MESQLYGDSGAAGTLCKTAHDFNLTQLDCINTYKVDAQIYLRSVAVQPARHHAHAATTGLTVLLVRLYLQHDYVRHRWRLLHRCLLLPADLCVCVQGSPGEHAHWALS
jgi:hypothetical protein